MNPSSNDPDPVLKIFSERLAALLQEKNIKRLDFAKMINVAPTTLSGYLNRKHFPEPNILIKICDFFNTTIDYLYGRTDNRFMEPASYSRTENEMLTMYKQLSENNKYLALGEVHMLLIKEKKAKDKD
ncbi:MAG: helix-turn-helix domain-containing protein [Candidatus Weimeria sp.]